MATNDATSHLPAALHQYAVIDEQNPRRVALLIDGQSLHFTAKALDFEVDFKRLLEHFGCVGSVYRAFYYAQAQGDQDAIALRPFFSWLDYNGFVVRQLPRKYALDEDRRKFKRNIGATLVADALQLAAFIEILFLFSGDGEFVPLVHAMQRRGVYVVVVSTMKPQIISDELRRSANSFLELRTLRAIIRRSQATSLTESSST